MKIRPKNSIVFTQVDHKDTLSIIIKIDEYIERVFSMNHFKNMT